MKRRSTLIALVAGLTSLVIAATLFGKHAGPPSRRAAHTRPVVIPYRPVSSGASDTARSVLYRFANAYGELSPGTAAQQYRLLVSLAAPPLLTQLRATGPDSALTATAAGVRGTGIDCLIVSLEVTAASGNQERGAVELEQWLVGPGESQVPPERASYVADLVRVGGAWRVSEFGLVA